MAAASSWPLSRQTALDLNGDVLVGARLNFFEAGTSTPMVVYSDPELDTPLPAWPDPILADASGRWPRVYLPYRDYRVRAASPAGVLLWDDDGIANPAPPESGSSIPTQQLYQTGHITMGFGLFPGFLALNGQTIGNGVSGATGRANADVEALYVHIYDNVGDDIAEVSGGRGANAQSDFAAGKTITLPDFRGIVPGGLVGMGNSLSTILDDVTFAVGAPDEPGSRFGTAFHALTVSELAAHSHGGTTGSTTGLVDKIPAFDVYPLGTGAPTDDFTLCDSTSDGDLDHSHTIASEGSGDGHANTQPTRLLFIQIKI